MSKKRSIILAQVFAIAVGLPLMLIAFSMGPLPGNTGGPGETTCFQAGCHSGTAIEDSENIALEFSGGSSYEPGVMQTLTVSVADATEGVQFYGFQLSVRGAEDAQAGSLAAAEGTTVNTLNGIQYINHTAPRPDGTFMFNWTPPEENVGPVTFYVAANAANGNFNPTGDRIHTQQFVLNPAGAELPVISDGGVVHGATFNAAQGFAPNTFGTIFGTNLVDAEDIWSDEFVEGVAPTTLGGARVLVNGIPAYIYFTRPGGEAGDQINFVFADDEARGDVQVVVETDQGTSEPQMIVLSDRAPAFFPFEPESRRYAAAIMNDASAYIGPTDLFGGDPLPLPIPVRPARAGDVIQLFATGLGPTDPPVPIGQIPPEGTISNTVEPVTVRLGETPADVLFAGLSQFVGLYQIVITVPNVANGDHELVAEIAGLQTQGGLFLAVENP